MAGEDLSSSELAEPAPTSARAETRKQDADDTDLRALVAAIKAAAVSLGIAEQPRPWLPALPNELTIQSLVRSFGAEPRAFAYGVEDHPDEQRQNAALIDLDTFGHLFVIGLPIGRLRTPRPWGPRLRSPAATPPPRRTSCLGPGAAGLGRCPAYCPAIT